MHDAVIWVQQHPILRSRSTIVYMYILHVQKYEGVLWCTQHFRNNREKITLEREIGRNAKNVKKSGDIPPEREIRHLCGHLPRILRYYRLRPAVHKFIADNEV